MTFQALYLLHNLKKARQTGSGTFYIDIDRNVLIGGHATRNNKSERKLCQSWEETRLALDHLEERGLIKRLTPNSGWVTHRGLHLGQIIFSAILLFLFRSVAVPIFVAFVTTILTLWVQGVFQALTP